MSNIKISLLIIHEDVDFSLSVPAPMPKITIIILKFDPKSKTKNKTKPQKQNGHTYHQATLVEVSDFSSTTGEMSHAL